MEPVDYLSGTSAGRRARVAGMLRRRETWFGLKLAWLFGGGALFTLIGPAVIATVMVAFTARFRVGWEWAGAFNVACLVMIPILLVAAARGHENPFLDELAAYGPEPAGSRGELEMRNETATWAFFGALFLIGPHMLLDGWDRLRAWARARRPDVARAGELVLHLYESGEGVEVSELLRPDESPQGLMAALRYLQLHDWVDLGQGGWRVWLCSPARRRLAERLGELRQPRGGRVN